MINVNTKYLNLDTVEPMVQGDILNFIEVLLKWVEKQTDYLQQRN
jgi:hypothetical protein